MLISLRLFVWMVPTYLADLRLLFGYSFLPLDSSGAMENGMSVIFSTAMQLLLGMLLPLFVVPLAILLGSLLPGGWVISTRHWLPRFSRLSPAANLGQKAEEKAVRHVRIQAKA